MLPNTPAKSYKVHFSCWNPPRSFPNGNAEELMHSLAIFNHGSRCILLDNQQSGWTAAFHILSLQNRNVLVYTFVSMSPSCLFLTSFNQLSQARTGCSSSLDKQLQKKRLLFATHPPLSVSALLSLKFAAPFIVFKEADSFSPRFYFLTQDKRTVLLRREKYEMTSRAVITCRSSLSNIENSNQPFCTQMKILSEISRSMRETNHSRLQVFSVTEWRLNDCSQTVLSMHIEHVRHVATNLFTRYTLVIASFYVPNLEARKDIVLEPITYNTGSIYWDDALKREINTTSRHIFRQKGTEWWTKTRKKKFTPVRFLYFSQHGLCFIIRKCAKCEECDDGE